MSAKTHAEQERIAGAKSCLAVIRRLEDILFLGSSDPDTPEWDAKRDAAIAVLLETAGELSPRAAGAMSVLAELVVSEQQDGSTLFLSRWKPEATMTISAKTRMRAKYIAAEEAV